jgi:hypothetical protein
MGKIVWLASYPKSGNTWLRAFLHNYVGNAAAPRSINALGKFSAVENLAGFFNKYDARPASHYAPSEVQAMRKRVHRDLMGLDDDLVFVKTHNANLEIHGAALCTAEYTAGAVYILRDPRDLAVSYAAYLGVGVDAAVRFMGQAGAANRGTEQQVFEFLGSWSAHVESWAAQPNTLVLRYEDLLNDPVAGFGKVIGFIGDGVVEKERLRRAVGFSEFATLAGQEAAQSYGAAGPAGKFFREGRAGQWYDRLSAAQVQLDHGAVMRRFGYLF